VRGGARGLLAVATVLCLAPTPGDIGGCGQTAEDLDPEAFFASKQAVECERCQECGLSVPACQLACEGGPTASAFPTGCFPLVHDGTVCLRALTQASCEDHEKAVAEPPRVPSECNFCPPVTPP
jgi:hypothetical protein